MMDFIALPLVVGLVTLGLYKFFELMICRRERRMIIEKLDGKELVDYVRMMPMGLGIPFAGLERPTRTEQLGFSSWALRIGGLFAGIGFGLLLAFILVLTTRFFELETSGSFWNLRNALYGGSVLFFGGVGLITSYFVERRLIRKDKE